MKPAKNPVKSGRKARVHTFSMRSGLAWIRRTIQSSRFLYEGPSSEAFSLNLSGFTFSFSVRLCKHTQGKAKSESVNHFGTNQRSPKATRWKYTAAKTNETEWNESRPTKHRLTLGRSEIKCWKPTTRETESKKKVIHTNGTRVRDRRRNGLPDTTASVIASIRIGKWKKSGHELMSRLHKKDS